MEIHPEDLDEKHQTYVLSLRVAHGAWLSGLSANQIKRRRWVPHWLSLSGTVSGIVFGSDLNYQNWLHGLVWGLLGGLCGYGCDLLEAVYTWIKVTQEKLQADEVAWIKHYDSDTLTGDYVALLTAVMTKPLPPTTDTSEVRRAIRNIGAALALTPPLDLEPLMVEPSALRAQAKTRTEEAEREPDSVIAASLRRRAIALTQQAETMERMATTVRRNQALRVEIQEQIKALRISLGAMEAHAPAEIHELSSLADTMESVALEARSAADARAEVENALIPLRQL